jgi:hypothetical protein
MFGDASVETPRTFGTLGNPCGHRRMREGRAADPSLWLDHKLRTDASFAPEEPTLVARNSRSRALCIDVNVVPESK